MSTRFSIISLVLALIVASPGQEKEPDPEAEAEVSVPATLAEAHAELEKSLSAEELAKIDAMESEGGMNAYHFGLGMGIRNAWGLWRGSALAKHMRELGFTHADDMSGVILATFWCKRHGEPLRLKERAAEYTRYWEAMRKAQEREVKRVESAKRRMREMMMGLELDASNVANVKIPDRINRSLRARFLAPYKGGVFISVRKNTGMGDDEYVTVPYFYSGESGKIHEVEITEFNPVSSAVLVGDTVWICGAIDGSPKPALLGISPDGRVRQELPENPSVPQLGIHGESLLAVYPKAVYELADGRWVELYRGEIKLPMSGPPPTLIDGMLYLRDEGSGENDKRLWWLEIGDAPTLVSLEDDMGVVGSDGPRWENSFSFAVSSSGDLWACLGEGYARKSLVRRTRTGDYSIAIMNNSLKFTPELFGSGKTDQGLSVSAVSCHEDGTLLLVADTGLFRLEGEVLRQELAFTNAVQDIPTNGGESVYHWSWDPSKIAILGEDSYMISGAFGGIYLLRKDGVGKWTLESLDEELGDPITW